MSVKSHGAAATCQIGTCAESAAVVVSHPFRPESQTTVCEHHAGVVLDEIDGATQEGEL